MAFKYAKEQLEKQMKPVYDACKDNSVTSAEKVALAAYKAAKADLQFYKQMMKKENE